VRPYRAVPSLGNAEGGLLGHPGEGNFWPAAQLSMNHETTRGRTLSPPAMALLEGAPPLKDEDGASPSVLVRDSLVVILTRPTGERLALNPDLIERVEERRALTVITLVDGAKYIVAESVQVVSERMLAYRQAVICGPTPDSGPSPDRARLRLAPTAR
jgi:uncharacterized protein YlzI (FlbEa/FlbD family)